VNVFQSQPKVKIIISLGQIRSYLIISLEYTCPVHVESRVRFKGMVQTARCCVVSLRANMPDKAAEEKAFLAKKLADQRAKGIEGIPTTAKVSL
jgi:hypothetical protein